MLAVLLVASALADPAGDALGAKVAAAAGNPWAEDRLTFTFVVEAAGAEKARRSHDWQPKAGALKVQGPDGVVVAFSGLHGHDLMAATVDPVASAATWTAVAPGTPPETAAKAWSWFVNDSYWLLAPTKVMDPGVNRTVDEAGRLRLQFDGVGLTPGDVYSLSLDPDTAQVVAWDFVLQSGQEGSFVWSAVQKVGGLTIPTHKVSGDGGFVIRFEGLSAGG